MQANESVTYNYTGKCQKITLSPGTYRFECYGGKGGGSTGASGDKTTGCYTILEDTDFFLYIGGQSTSSAGGWGNGATVTESGVYGGGGATSIALDGTENSTDWNDPKHVGSRLMMAAGGQGQGKTGGATTGTASNTRIDARTEYINRTGVQAGYIIPKTSGTLIFQSTSYSHDPYGFVDNANGGNIVSNDDSGRAYTGNSWDFRIELSVTAGTKYVLRVGSFASSLGTTGWATWFATFPNAEAVLYTVVTSGGQGGGSNYYSSLMFDKSTTSFSNASNGKIVITRVGHRLITENCAAETAYVVGGETVQLSAPKTLWIDGYAQVLTGFQSSYPKVNVVMQNGQYFLVISGDLDMDLAFQETITIEAIFTKLRCNSNFYKDSIPQENFDYYKLFGEVT